MRIETEVLVQFYKRFIHVLIKSFYFKQTKTEKADGLICNLVQTATTTNPKQTTTITKQESSTVTYTK